MRRFTVFAVTLAVGTALSSTQMGGGKTLAAAVKP